MASFFISPFSHRHVFPAELLRNLLNGFCLLHSWPPACGWSLWPISRGPRGPVSDQMASVSLHGPQESKRSVQDKPERGAEKTELLLPPPPSRSGVSESVRPQRRQPTRLPVPGILQARVLEWAATAFSGENRVVSSTLLA